MEKKSLIFYQTLLREHFNLAIEKYKKILDYKHAVDIQNLEEPSEKIIWVEHHYKLAVPHVYMTMTSSCDEIVRFQYHLVVSPIGDLQYEWIKVVKLGGELVRYGDSGDF